MKQIRILLVEDNEGDIFLTMEALQAWKVINKITVARDGKEALAALQANDLPDLILLDVNLPKKNGHEVLQYIKGNDDIKHIPVIMLTTSSSEKDILQSYKQHANCYITKPVEVEDFFRTVAGIEDFWISIVRLPPN